jgi:urease accessory protein
MAGRAQRLHRPLQGEGRIARGDPGWGDSDAVYAGALPSPPDPLARADVLPPAASAHATFAANRARGYVSLTFAATERGTHCATTREEGSLRVRFPRACACAPEAVLVNTAGGIAGGDRFGVDLELQTGAEVVVTTTAAEKIYRSLGPNATFDLAAKLADGAALTWLPRETILFDRARLARAVDIALAPTATLLFAETVMFGRAAMGEAVQEGFLTDRWRVRRGGRLVFAENFRLDGPIADRLGEAAIAGGHAAIGTVLMAPADEAAVAAVRAMADQFRGEVGISAWSASPSGGIALARLAAANGALLRHDLVVVLSALGRQALPRIWLN